MRPMQELRAADAASLKRDLARLWWTLALSTVLAACSLVRAPAPVQVPPPPIDINAIPDAVPRIEPRSPYGNPPYYDEMGRRYYVLQSAAGYDATGVASWYGPSFHEKRTSSGEPYDMYAMTAAHKTLPLPTYVRVTNLENGRSVVVRVNDRGPFVANRLIDLSYTAAAKLDMLQQGTALVEVRALTPGQPVPPPAAAQTLTAANTPERAPAAVSTPVDPPSAPAPTPVPATALPSPAPVSASVPGTAAAAPSATVYLQAGAFADPRNAERVLERLRGGGVPAAFVMQPRAGDSLFRVRVGPLASVEDLDRWAARLAQLGFADAIVVRAN